MYVEDVEDGKRTYTHIFAHNFLNIQPIFNLQKVFEKLRLRAFQPYHQILCILKHVADVEDRSNTPKGCNAMYVEDVKESCCRIMSKMSKILKQAITFLTDFLEFISLMSEILKMCRITM